MVPNRYTFVSRVYFSLEWRILGTHVSEFRGYITRCCTSVAEVAGECGSQAGSVSRLGNRAMLKLDSILEGVAELTGSRLANGSLLALPPSSTGLQEFPILSAPKEESHHIQDDPCIKFSIHRSGACCAETWSQQRRSLDWNIQWSRKANTRMVNLDEFREFHCFRPTAQANVLGDYFLFHFLFTRVKAKAVFSNFHLDTFRCDV